MDIALVQQLLKSAFSKSEFDYLSVHDAFQSRLAEVRHIDDFEKLCHEGSDLLRESRRARVVLAESFPVAFQVGKAAPQRMQNGL